MFKFNDFLSGILTIEVIMISKIEITNDQQNYHFYFLFSCLRICQFVYISHKYMHFIQAFPLIILAFLGKLQNSEKIEIWRLIKFQFISSFKNVKLNKFAKYVNFSLSSLSLYWLGIKLEKVLTNVVSDSPEL